MSSKCRDFFLRAFSLYEHLFLFCIVLAVVGMLFSTFLFGLSYAFLAMLALLCLSHRPEYRDAPSLKVVKAGFLLLGVPALIYMASGMWSEDLSYYLVRLRVKIPLLLVPCIAYLLPDIGYKTYRSCLIIFCTALAVSVLQYLFSMVGHTSEVVDHIRSGDVWPTPVNHIRYSLMISLGFLIGLIMGTEYDSRRRVIWYSLALFFFIALHILAVRSGLATSYILLIVYCCFRAVRRKEWTLLIIPGYLGIMVLVALQLPFIQSEIYYSREATLKSKTENHSHLYSDGDRRQSILSGIAIAKDHLWLGVGAGDLLHVMEEEMKGTEYNKKVILPHNQYLTYWLASGIVGLALFVFSLMGCFFWAKFWKSSFLWVHFVLILLSMLVENTMESALGVAIMIYPLLIGILYLRHQLASEQGLDSDVCETLPSV